MTWAVITTVVTMTPFAVLAVAWLASVATVRALPGKTMAAFIHTLICMRSFLTRRPE